MLSQGLYNFHMVMLLSGAFVKFNKESIQNYGPPLLDRLFKFLIVKLRVDLSRSADCLGSNLVTVWVDAQLKNCFGNKFLSRRMVFKTKNYTRVC